MSKRRPSYAEAWTSISDCAKACRDFNELQFKYRQLIITVVLASYAAMGYFWATAEASSKPSGVSELAAAIEHLAVGKIQPHTPAPTDSASAPAVTNSSGPKPSAKPTGHDIFGNVLLWQATKDSEVATVIAAKAKTAREVEARRVSLILMFVGTLTAIASIFIWILDCQVYHRLLVATFRAGLSFERKIFRTHGEAAPPLLHIWMHGAVPQSSGVEYLVSAFYGLASVSGLVPWALYVYLNAGVSNDWTTSVFAPRVALGLLALALVIFGLRIRAQIGLTYQQDESRVQASLNTDANKGSAG